MGSFQNTVFASVNPDNTKLPFGVAGDGARYLRMRLGLLMNGMPVNWLMSAALMSILRGALKNDWCMYFS